MPVPSFLTSFADKAQSAISAAGYNIPSSSPHSTAHPSANEAAAEGGHRSHNLGSLQGSLQNQLRALGQQYATTTPVQKIITIEKSVAIDFDGISRDAKSQSKELYTWGQLEEEDIKDVTDRLAYLNFVQGSLASSLALKLDSARAPLKALRDAETKLTPRRNMRSGLQLQLSKLEHEQQKGAEKRIAELKDQIKDAELDDQVLEKEAEILKRKAVRESEQLKWEALREYGEKLALLSQAATLIIGALPSIPPSQTSPYVGAQTTGAARASLQRALDNYKTGHINLPPQASGAHLHRSDTLSFGETHASELSSINSDITSPGIPSTPPYNDAPLSDAPTTTATKPQHDVPSVINPAALNQSPAIIPTTSSRDQASSLVVASDSEDPFVSNNVPTVAETGIPVTAGADGPGPASGSLYDIKHSVAPVDTPASESSVIQKHESAEEEKKRLATAYSLAGQQETGLSADPGASTSHDEKERLEREERESNSAGNNGSENNHEELPAYHDL
ncbi:hypothetical protein L208DRAFT_1388723 [Tricholoma matsutake]|nr:hypothetical protein L208DRAFT_1388723 [Tricholoma matsutake 945]